MPRSLRVTSRVTLYKSLTPGRLPTEGRAAAWPGGLRGHLLQANALGRSVCSNAGAGARDEVLPQSDW